LTLDFWPSDYERINFCCFKPHSSLYFSKAATENQYCYTATKSRNYEQTLALQLLLKKCIPILDNHLSVPLGTEA
jgi:hypothetical protein